MPIIQDLLSPSVVTKMISRINIPGPHLSKFFGTEMGGPATEQINGRTYTYDIYDHTRKVANARMPGTPAGSVALNPTGNVTVTLAEFTEKIQLSYDKLIQIRTLGANAGVYDRMGKRYVEAQMKTLKQRSDNVREFMTAAVLCRGGKYSFYQSGDDLLPSFDQSGGFITVNHQIPSSNLLVNGSFAAGLQMGTGSNIITASWATASTDIPLALDGISAGFQLLVGQPLRYVLCNSVAKNYILQNDKVRQLAGTSNTPFAVLENTSQKNPDGTDGGVYRFVLKGLPYIEFIVYDGVLDVSASGATPTPTKLLQDGYCTFLVEKDNEWLKMIEGSKIIKDNDLAPAVERIGFYSHMLERADPARFEMHTHNTLGMELNRPKAVAYARVA